MFTKNLGGNQKPETGNDGVFLNIFNASNCKFNAWQFILDWKTTWASVILKGLSHQRTDQLLGKNILFFIGYKKILLATPFRN